MGHKDLQWITPVLFNDAVSLYGLYSVERDGQMTMNCE